MSWRDRGMWTVLVFGLVGLSAGCEGSDGASCETTTVDGRDYCVASGPIIETGFDCPASYPNRHREGDVVICSKDEDVPESDRQKIARRHGDDGDDEWRVDEDDESMSDSSDSSELDLLWVIDNSGSMCEEQEALRVNFRRFIESLRDQPVDLHLGVTTTSYEAPYEVVSPNGTWGHLQSTPHPPTGFDQECQKDENKADLFQSLRNQIEAAVACTKKPSEYEHLTNLSDDQIKCALGGSEATDACQRAGWSAGEKSPEQLFPCGDKHGERCDSREQFERIYRDLPKVVRSSDYEDADGALQIDELQQDFACMSYVGTRGDSTEQGLKAAVEAISPEKTGGTTQEPIAEHGGAEAPNHGFLRKNAETGVIFVTDENDCSRPSDADLNGEFGCGEMGCYYAAAEGRSDQDPLFSTQQLAEEFLDNLAASKQVDSVDPSDVVMGSIHGKYLKYGSRDGQEIVRSCGSQMKELRYAAHVCRTDLGAATSGDRYGDFLSHFTRTFPAPGSSDDGEHRKGWMCHGNFGHALERFAETF